MPREPIWTDRYNELRDLYDKWMAKLEAVLAPANPRPATEREAYAMCEATRLVESALTLLSLSFPGEYVEELGSRALSAFEKAHELAPEGSAFRENIALRREELERLLREWLPANRPQLRRWLEDIAPGNLDLADEAPPE